MQPCLSWLETSITICWFVHVQCPSERWQLQVLNQRDHHVGMVAENSNSPPDRLLFLYHQLGGICILITVLSCVRIWGYKQTCLCFRTCIMVTDCRAISIIEGKIIPLTKSEEKTADQRVCVSHSCGVWIH